MTADRATELCNQLLEKYEEEINIASVGIQGKTYQELYDVRTQRRSEEYDRLYDEVVEELVKMGVPFNK